MNVIHSMRCTITRLFAISALSLTSLTVSAVPLQPGLLLDPAFQACLDETALANGWTTTEEVTSLTCSERKIQFLAGVEVLTNLLELDLSENQIATASPIDLIPQLNILNLSNNKLLDIFSLQVLQNLTQINLSGNTRLLQFDVQNLIYMNPGLTHIGIAGIEMSDLFWLPPVGPMGEFNLIELDVSNTGVYPDLGPQVAQYSNLRVLKAAGNQLQFTGPLDFLTQLEVLDLSDNQLIDVYSLQMLQGLKQLNLTGNYRLDPIFVQQIIQTNSGLTHIGIGDIQMGDLNWLPPVGPMGEFDLIELDVSNIGAFSDLGPQVFQYTNLRVLKASGNQLQYAWLDMLTQLEVLDLSDNQLIDINSLQMLIGLTQLNLTGNPRLDPLIVQQVIGSNPGLTHIGVGGISMGDLSWLPPSGMMGGFNLIELDISNTGSFTDMFPLAQYPNLRALKAAGNNLQNVWPLDQLTQLEVLDLSENQLIDVFPLQMLFNLSQINLTGNHRLDPLSVQQIIQSNPGLTHIGVGGVSMGDLNWLPPVGPMGEFRLVELDISNIGAFPDLGPQLAQYSSLRVLKAAGNQLQFTGLLDQLVQLEVLDLSDNQLTDINSLQMLNGLKQLNLSGNSLLDPWFVQQSIMANPGLTHIGVAGIKMGDLGWLPPIGPMGEFNLIELDIRNIGAFPNLDPRITEYTGLRVLKASGNKLQHLGSLDWLTQLEELDLSDNQLIDIFTLQFMSRLTKLNLSGNHQLDAMSVQQAILANPGLTHIDVAGITMGDLNWLPPVGFMGEFNLVELDISNTGAYFDLGPQVSQYFNLRVLKAAGNQLQYTGPIDFLTQLEVVDLSDNQLKDVYSLQSLQRLTQLNLSGNHQLDPFSVQQVILANPGLTHIGVAGIAMGDLNWLPPIGPMGEFDLVELDVSNTGVITDLGPQLAQYSKLRVLKAAGNYTEFTGPLDLLTQLEILDLSDNQLTDIYSLQNLHKLTQLDLSGNHLLPEFQVEMAVRSNPGLTHLSVAGIPMSTLNWLPPIGPMGEYNLVELDISYTTALADLSFMAQYHPNLRVFKTAGNQVQFTGFFDQLTQLEVLDLSDNLLTDVYSLQALNGLTQLNLSGNSLLPAFDVQILIQNNPGLTHIGVAEIPMGDLSWLPPTGPTGESNLLELDFSNTGIIPDLFPLAQHTNLRVIRASGNQIQNAGPIEQLTQLEVLDLSENELLGILQVEMLHGLKQLNLSGNNLLPAFEVQFVVQANPGLTHIGVADISMGNLFWLPPVGLQGEYNLVELDISSTGALPDVSQLSQYTNLKVLKAANNGIEKIWSFEQLQQLQVLDLSNNRLEDIVPLQVLNKLQQLDLSNNVLPHPFAPGIDLFSINQVTNANPGITHLNVGGAYLGQLFQLSIFSPGNNENIVELGVSNTGIVDINPVTQLINLRVLDASDNLIEDVSGMWSMQQLEIIDLSNNNIEFVSVFMNSVTLKSLNLLGNNGIQCTELDQLEMSLLPGVLIRPETCILFNAPQVEIISLPPVPDTYATDIVFIEAIAFDLEDGPLESLIQWSSNLIGPLGTGQTLNTNLIAGDHIVTASVTDSHGNTSTASVNITVLPNTAPEVMIYSVTDGAVFNQGEDVFLDADANDFEDGNVAYTIQWSSDLDGYLGSGPFIIQNILSAGNHVITATATDITGATGTKSVSITINGLPQLTILSPLNGSFYQQGEAALFSATANDAEDGVLDVNILWSSNIDGMLGAGAQLTQLLSPGIHDITATISDSLGATVTQTTLVEVNALPQINILSPLNGSLIQQGDMVNLTATANDFEDGLIGANINWSSSIDGLLGVGEQLSPVLTVGSHIITASITDGRGASATQTVTVTVNALPQLTIQSPLSGGLYQQGDSITLSATASDVEDGILSASVNWSSSLDGVIGTGAQLTKVLSVGNHVITASIIDSAGATTTQTSTVSVNSTPVVTLQSPLSGTLFMLQESVNLTAAANDLEDGIISSTIQWSSNLDGPLGTGATLATNLSLGTHTLTASITDSAGGVHSVTTQLVIDQVALGVTVSGNGRKKYATLNWSGSRTAVDIYKNGVIVASGAASGSTVLRFMYMATFKVCETATNNCSIDVVVGQ